MPDGWLRSKNNRYRPEQNCYLFFISNFRSTQTIEIVDFERNGEGDYDIHYNVSDGDTVQYRNTLTVTFRDGGWRAVRNAARHCDFIAIFQAMDVAGVNFTFASPGDLSDEELFRFGMWALNYDRVRFEEWESWETSDGWVKVPVSAIQDTLNLHLEDVTFHPQGIEGYHAEEDAVRVGMIGGYGGVRTLQLRSQSEEAGVTTMVIDFLDNDTLQPYKAITYRMKIDDQYQWELLSATMA